MTLDYLTAAIYLMGLFAGGLIGFCIGVAYQRAK